ncbi:2-keto-3-deoxygluconate kinase [Haloactinopolyspora alba]|uniref:2-keto-3-deoxygluconate kinase n=1 Tax=Haloactinopolyspora alba TaxID=648780 RepID=A0A2P8E2E1_9ACTN|nr:sugar kinase [Haloactinopolyspora alba]PSL03635.1 2-keto-3-deoxygluconate kinase [Haloactinopolyspora alba]
MAEIVSFGEPLVEFNAEAVGGPRSGALYSIGFGGDSSNFAIATARLDGRAGYLTRVGDDRFGRMLLDLWRDEGVDASRVATDPEHPTGLYFIVRDGSAAEFVYRRDGSAAAQLCPEHIPDGWVERARLLHVTGITQAIGRSACDAVFQAVERARAADTIVTYDPNIRPKLWPLHEARAVTRYTAAMCDVVMPNLEEGRLLTGRDDPYDIAMELLELGAPLAVLKMGSAGAVVASAADYTRVPALDVRAVDPTGAGDTFNAAFAVATVEGRSPAAAALLGSAAAAHVVQGLGAVNSIPQRRVADRLAGELSLSIA